jgi:hypothetical protein
MAKHDYRASVRPREETDKPVGGSHPARLAAHALLMLRRPGAVVAYEAEKFERAMQRHIGSRRRSFGQLLYDAMRDRRRIGL